MGSNGRARIRAIVAEAVEAAGGADVEDNVVEIGKAWELKSKKRWLTLFG